MSNFLLALVVACSISTILSSLISRISSIFENKVLYELLATNTLTDDELSLMSTEELTILFNRIVKLKKPTLYKNRHAVQLAKLVALTKIERIKALKNNKRELIKSKNAHLN